MNTRDQGIEGEMVCVYLLSLISPFLWVVGGFDTGYLFVSYWLRNCHLLLFYFPFPLLSTLLDETR